MSTALLPLVPPELKALGAVYVGAAARRLRGGPFIHTTPALAVPVDGAALTAAGLRPDPHRSGAWRGASWRVWPAPDGIEAFVRARGIPVDAFAVSLDGALIDPLSGASELAEGQFSVPDAAWADDCAPLLVPALGSELGRRLEPRAMEQLAEHAPRILRADRDRVREALTQLLVGRHPSGGLHVIARGGVLPLVLPEVASLIDFHRSSRHHHKDVWNHTRQVVRQAVPRPIIRWAALLHDIGKAHTRSYARGGKVQFLHHDVLGAVMFEGIAHRLQFPADEAERIRLLILHHLRSGMYNRGWTDAAVRRFAAEMAPFLDDLIALSRADVTSKRPGKRRKVLFTLRELRTRIEAIRKADAEARPRVPKGLGRSIIDVLGVRPGPRVGELRRLCDLAARDGRLPAQPAIEDCLAFLRTVLDRDAA